MCAGAGSTSIDTDPFPACPCSADACMLASSQAAPVRKGDDVIHVQRSAPRLRPAALIVPAVILGAVVLGAAAPLARADTFLVNTGADDELNPPAGSLRAAVLAAQPGDVIEFVQNLTVRLETGFDVLEAADSLTIRGPVTLRTTGGAGGIVVHANSFTLADVRLEDTVVVVGRSDAEPPLLDLALLDCTIAAFTRMDVGNTIDARIERCRFEGARRQGDPYLALGDSEGTSVIGCTFGPDAPVTIGAARGVTFAGNTTEGGAVTIRAPDGGIAQNVFGGGVTVSVVPSPDVQPGDVLLVLGNRAAALTVQRTGVVVGDNVVGPDAVPLRLRGPRAKSPLVTGRRAPLLQVLALEPLQSTRPDVLGPVDVSGNEVTGGPAGLLVRDATGGAVAFNVSNNTVRDCETTGLAVLDLANALVAGNTVADIAPRSGKKAALGLLVDGSGAGVEVRGNTVQRVAGTGVRIAGPADVVLSGTTVEDCTGYGIETSGAPGTVAADANGVTRCARGGVRVARRWTATFTGGAITDNGKDGVSADAQARLTLTSVEVTGNTRDGVAFGKRAVGAVDTSHVAGNGAAGVRIQGRATVRVLGTTTGANGGVGIDIDPKGATANRKRKKGNDDFDFPEMAFVAERRRLEGTCTPGATVEVFEADDSGQGVVLLGSVVVAQDGTFAFPADGPLDCADGTPLVATATRIDGRVTSEFSDVSVCEQPVIPILRASQNSLGAGPQSFAEIRSYGVINSWAGRAISDDGRYVVFATRDPTMNAGDPVFGAADTNGALDVFVHDAVTRTTVHASNVPGGGFATSQSGSGYEAGSCATLSGDGRFVFYASSSSDFVDLFGFAYAGMLRRDLQTGAVLPFGQIPSQSGPPGGVEPATNRDGSLCAFVHTSTYYREDDLNLSADVYLWTGGASFEHVSRAYDGSVGFGGAQGRTGACHSPRLSGDGNVVAFVSVLQGLVENGPSDFQPRVYVRNRSADTIDVASRGPAGELAVAAEFALSDGGRYVAFVTNAALVAEDTDTTGDVYVRDLQAGTTSLVSVEAEGDTVARTAFRPSISDDGNLVAFEFRRTSNPNSVREVWLRDRAAGTTVRLSGGRDGAVNSHGEYPVLTPDGHFCVFVSTQPDLIEDDDNLQQDVFRRDLRASTD